MTLHDLRDLGLVSGQGKTEQLSLAIEGWRQGGFTYVPVGGAQLDATLDVTSMDTGWAMRLRFATTLEGPCARCLDTATVHINVDSREVHDVTVRPDDEAADDLRSDFLDHDELLDVVGWAVDAIGIEFPTKVLCREDCAGLCPRCGANRNGGECGCDLTIRDARWDKLAELSFDGEQDGA